MSMSKSEPKFYYLEGSITQIYTAWGLEEMLNSLNKENNEQIEMDLYGRVSVFHIPHIKEKLEEHFLPKVETNDNDPIRKRYMQGDIDSGNLRLMTGEIPFVDENDPYYDSGNMPKYIDNRAAYLDSKSLPAGISVFYQQDKPEQWIMVVTRETHLPKNECKAYVLSSIDLNAFILDDSLKTEEFNLDSLPNGQEKLVNQAGLPQELSGISDLIKLFLKKDGKINPNADLLFSVFTGMLSKQKKFDDDELWLTLLGRTTEIMENRSIIALNSSLEPPDKLSKEEIRDCLDPESKLFKTLKVILDNELVQQSTIKDQLVQFVHHLYQFGRLDKFSTFNYSNEVDSDFFVFFNSWANKAKGQEGELILSDTKLGELRDFHGMIRTFKNATELMTLLKGSNKQVQLTDQLLKLTKFIEENEKELDKNVLSLAFEFIARGEGKEVPYSKLIGFLKQTAGIEQIQPGVLLQFLSNHIDDDTLLESVQGVLVKLVALKIENSELYELALSSEEFRKEITTLDHSSAQGALKILSELTIPDSKSYEKLVLRSEEFRNKISKLEVQEALAKLVELNIADSKLYELVVNSEEFRKEVAALDGALVKRTLQKLVELKIPDSKSYEKLVLRSEEFRKLIAAKDTKVDAKATKDAKDAEEIQKYIKLAKNLDEIGYFSAFSQLSTNLNWVSSFNELVKNKGIKDSLVQKLAAPDVAKSCKPILENSLLKSLAAADIEIGKGQVDKILDPENALAKKLQRITKEANSARKKALYQLAIDLDQICVLGAFDKFEKDDNEFLELFHKLVTTPDSQLVLSLMLSKDPVIGIDALRLMAYSGNAIESFKKFLENNTPQVIDKLNWLTKHRAEYSKEITSMAMEFLLKHSDIDFEKFKFVVTFLNSTPKCDASRKKMIEFLSAHYNDHDLRKLFSEVTETYKKLHALGVNKTTLYELALENQAFQDIVQHHLLPMNAADTAGGCGLKRIKGGIFSAEGLKDYCIKKNWSSNYILTEDALFYFNKSKNELLTINLEESQLEELKKQFPLSITQLKSDNFEKLTKFALLQEQNISLIGLAGELHKLNAINRYESLASETKYASTFLQFIQIQFVTISSELQKRLQSDDISTTNIKALLDNKRLIALANDLIDPSKNQFKELLNPKSEISQAMQILLQLRLNHERKVAYKWAIIASPTAKNFRNVLFDIDAKKIKPETTSKIIDTFCSLQFGDRDQRSGRPNFNGKDVFSMYLRADEQGERFREIVLQLPPISADEESLGFFRMEKSPTEEEFKKYQESRYILTTDALLFFNTKDKRLLTISVDKLQIDALNKIFTQLPIKKLTNEQFKQLSEIVPTINKTNAQLTMLAYNLCELGDITKFDIFTDLEQISYFNKFCDDPVLKKILGEKLHSPEATKALLNNKRVRAVIDANISPTAELIEKLDKESPESRLIDILLELNVKNQKDYKWAILPSTVAKFDKVFSAITKEPLDEAIKSKIIKTLCSLQMGGKDVFGMYLDTGNRGKAFRSSLFKIEDASSQIGARLSNEAPEKGRSFNAAEQEYRKGLYTAVYDNQIKLSKGCDLHLMSELPSNTVKYKNSYIFIQKDDDTKGLFYINSDGKHEKVKIDDFRTLENLIKVEKDRDKNANKLSLNEKQMHEMIIANGGHIPYKEEFEANITKASQQILSIVDVRRRNWFIAIIETLADALSNIKTMPSQWRSGKTFFSQTTSGNEVRTLNESLKDPQTLMKKYKGGINEINKDADLFEVPSVVQKLD
ncbi:hypothetical protein [Legionella sp. PC997]|uniref:hypothetical protein n=1 Tax=Legionella sp. PC997 TaxID=2755562 RepID=UPI0015FCAF62|nr:hypothetical protein [Legionella sp. PC997]QMT58658.1 hypothetical protein HBNCFIEN_00011 [Legionella sp. PC997]